MYGNKWLYTISSALAICFSVRAQGPDLKDITDGKYKEKKLPSVCAMNDGEHYTLKGEDNKTIVRYAYRTGLPADTLFNTATAKDCPFETFEGYSFSPDETKILIYTDSEKIYRRSFKASYYIFEIKRNRIKSLSENGKQQSTLFSPNGRMVAFVRDNNIFLKKLDYGTESAVTRDGEKNKIINGIPDWVYEEEFATTLSMSWSPDNAFLTFIKYDETEVPQYDIQLFEGYCPALTRYALYPGAYTYKYPVAGEKNAVVSVHSYSVETKGVRQLDVPTEKEDYIPRLLFTDNPEQLAVVTMNRHQNRLRVYAVNPKSGVSRLLVQDESDTWIDPENINGLHFYPDFFTFVSDRDGYRHLYQYSRSGALMRQITRGEWEMTDFLGYNAKTKSFFYQSTQQGPLYRAIYRTDGQGKTTLLSTEKGTNQAWLNPTGIYFINQYSSIETPSVYTICNSQGKTLHTLLDNRALRQQVENVTTVKKEFFTFRNPAGIELNGWIIKPAGFDASKKYPAVMVQYSGPGSQSVRDRWDFGWEEYLAENGYVVASVDGRGTGGRGAAFEKSVYLRLGILESDDQIAAARYIGSLGFTDKDRIAIWGWSFGGYMTLMSMTRGKDIYRAGIAIAPVTDWKYYDSIYTERFMRTPKENDEGYRNGSPLMQANELSGRLLLITGTADDNVHYLNSLQYASALVEADIQFDMMYYTNRNHSITGCNTRYHLYTKITDFLNRELK